MTKCEPRDYWRTQQPPDVNHAQHKVWVVDCRQGDFAPSRLLSPLCQASVFRKGSSNVGLVCLLNSMGDTQMKKPQASQAAHRRSHE